MSYGNYNMPGGQNFNNPYPGGQNFNNPIQGNYIPLCNLCKGSGYYINNGMNIPCKCGQPNPDINYNYNEFPIETIHSPVKHQPHHKNIFSRAWSALTNCASCGGRGFINGWTHSGHQKVCYDCIRASGYCPACENSGYKIHNGKPCKCGLF